MVSTVSFQLWGQVAIDLGEDIRGEVAQGGVQQSPIPPEQHQLLRHCSRDGVQQHRASGASHSAQDAVGLACLPPSALCTGRV